MGSLKFYISLAALFVANLIVVAPCFAQAQVAPQKKIEAIDARDKKHMVIIGNAVKLTVPWWDSFVSCAARASVASTFYTQNKLQGAQDADQYVKIFGDLALDRMIKDRKIEAQIVHQFLQDKFTNAYQSEGASLSLIIKSFGSDAAKSNVEKWKPICFDYVKEYKGEFSKPEPKVKEYLDAIADRFPK